MNILGKGSLRESLEKITERKLSFEEKILRLNKIASFLELDDGNAYSYYGTIHPDLDEIYFVIKKVEGGNDDLQLHQRVDYFLEKYSAVIFERAN